MRSLRLLPLALLLPLAGCLSIRPFAEVRREQPPERFVRVGSQEVYVEQAGEGKETVVLLHGFGASSYSWRHLIPELAKSFRVVAPDFSGFGYTERPRDPASYTREGQARLALGVLDALGVERAHFVGHSYGGSLTLYLAARHPERVRSIVLIDSAAPTFPNDRRSRLGSLRPVNALFLRLLLRPNRVRKSLANTFYDGTLATPELAHEYQERLAVEGVGDAYRGLTVPTRDDFRVDLAKIDLPALVVWGADDPLIKVEDGRRAAETLGARFVVMEKVGHVPMEERPEELLAIVAPFLREQARPPRAEGRSLSGEPLVPPALPAELLARREEQLREAKAALAANPDDADALIWVGRRTAYLGRYREAIDIFTQGVARHPRDARFLRHRGHRFLTVRELERAERDLEQAARLIAGRADEIEPDGLPNARNIPTSTLQSNIWYHLGLARYLQGDFAGALEAYRPCLAVSKNPDMEVASRYWLYLNLRRLGRDAEAREILTPVRADQELLENHAYHRLLLLYKGEAAPADLLAAADGDLDPATIGYGTGVWHFLEGRREEAARTFRQVVERGPWAAFGALAAEAELARMGKEAR